MVYNDIEFSKRGVEASILSIKNDINRKIGLVELRYNDVYNAIIEENNKLVDFLNEFRAAVDTIVNECNNLQGLTDEELTEIKQKIEELKQILDSIDIPDLPKIKKPDEVFSGITEEKPDGKPKYTGISVPNANQPLDDSTNKDTTTFYCGSYSASVNEDNIGEPDCQANYIIWAGGCSASDDIPAEALCVSGYDETTYNDDHKDGTVGCLSKYDSAYNETICATGYAFSKDSDTLVCINDYHEPVGEHSCDKGFIIDYWGTRCEGGYSQDTMTREGGISCPLDYSDDGSGGSLCSGGYSDHEYATCTGKVDLTYYNPVCGQSSTESVNVTNCPQEFSNGDGLDSCTQDYTNGDVQCNSKYGHTPGSQSIGSCQNGFTDGTTSCEGRWQDSEVGNMSACQRNYRNGHVSCTKNYVTDGHFVYCDNSDTACHRCVNCDSCVGGANCSSCNSPSCFSCYGKSNGSSPPCGESTPCEQCPDHTPVQPCKCCHNSIGWDYFLCQANGDNT